MSNRQPTTAEVYAVIIAQLEASFNQRIPLLPKAFNRVLAKVLAGVVITLYKYAGAMALNQFVRFASNEETEINGETLKPLTEYGELFGLGVSVAGTQAEHTANINVSVLSGTLPGGTQLTYTPTGVTYLTIGDVALDASIKEITIRASRDQAGGNGAGAIGNLALGTEVTFVSQPSNVSGAASVTGTNTTGANAETTEEYRRRVLDFTQRRPQGGAPADWEEWGEGTAGIINTYPYKGDPGEVDLYSEATPESSGSADGIPTAAQLVAVKENTELNAAGRATRRSINSYVNSYAITRTAYTAEVRGLVVDNTTETEALITEAIEQYFTDREPFISGLQIPPRKDRVVHSEVSGAVSNVVSASGGIFESVTVKKAGVVITLDQLGIGEKAKASSVTFP